MVRHLYGATRHDSLQYNEVYANVAFASLNRARQLVYLMVMLAVFASFRGMEK